MDNFSLLNNKIEDNKAEKIAFVIDLSEELKREDIINYNGDKMERLKVILDEILNFIKIKDYFSSKPTQFALYTYTASLSREIDFCDVKNFDSALNDLKSQMSSKIIDPINQLDLALIYKEAMKLLGKNEKLNSKTSNNNETIIRFILFYNRSTLAAINTCEKEFNLMTFTRINNFCFDLLFIRKKITSEEDKFTLNEVFNSLTISKPKFWYAMEISGNLSKLKFFMNLLLANAAQRIKLSDIDKHQKRIAEVHSNYAERD